MKINKETFRIMVLDEHPILLHGMELLLEERPEYKICWKGDNTQEAKRAIETVKPDLLVMDLFLKEIDGLEYIKEVHAAWPELPVLVFSMSAETLYAEPALRAGARGYLMQDVTKDVVLSSIEATLNGEIVLSERVRERMVGQALAGRQGLRLSPIERLTARELEVFRLLGEGFGTRRIAQELGLSVKTIETYRTNIMEKLSLKKSTELVLYAYQWRNKREGKAPW